MPVGVLHFDEAWPVGPGWSVKHDVECLDRHALMVPGDDRLLDRVDLQRPLRTEVKR
jgi:hypothetical protein